VDSAIESNVRRSSRLAAAYSRYESSVRLSTLKLKLVGAAPKQTRVQRHKSHKAMEDGAGKRPRIDSHAT
jgi:hypothetical protein